MQETASLRPSTLEFLLTNYMFFQFICLKYLRLRSKVNNNNLESTKKLPYWATNNNLLGILHITMFLTCNWHLTNSESFLSITSVVFKGHALSVSGDTTVWGSPWTFWRCQFHESYQNTLFCCTYIELLNMFTVN